MDITQIWRECTKCGWTTGLPIGVMDARVEFEVGQVPTLTITAMVDQTPDIGLFRPHTCPKEGVDE
jgi:hypothetical protein